LGNCQEFQLAAGQNGNSQAKAGKKMNPKKMCHFFIWLLANAE